MAQLHGIAGEWARVKGTVAGLWPLFIGVFLLGFSIALGVFANPGVGAVLTVLSLAWCAFSLVKGLRHVERFFKGAKGEERVAEVLARLPDAYHVFNDFVAGREHIDHVVVGPTGVFAVETKFWRGQVTLEEGHILLDGQLPSRSPLGQSVREAAAVKAALAAKGWDGDVTPILAFAGDNFHAHIGEVGRALIINACDLEKSFRDGREVLAAGELERLVGLMGV